MDHRVYFDFYNIELCEYDIKTVKIDVVKGVYTRIDTFKTAKLIFKKGYKYYLIKIPDFIFNKTINYKIVTGIKGSYLFTYGYENGGDFDQGIRLFEKIGNGNKLFNYFKDLN